MRSDPFRWCLAALALGAVVAATSFGQEFRMPSLGDPADAAQASSPQRPQSGDLAMADAPAPHLAAQDPPSDNLARRVAELESALKAQLQKEAAAKSAAARRPTVIPAGRMQFDIYNVSQDDTSISQYGNVRNAIGFRRARIALLGEAFDVVNYIVEMDFANRGINAVINSKDQSTAFKDVYVQVRELPLVGNVRVGHMKEPFGLEDLLSDNYTSFMERSIDDEGMFAPGRNNGIMAFDWSEDERMTWSIGTFANQTGFDQPPTFQYDQWGLDLTGRVTWLAWYDEASGGRGVLHTGLDYSYRDAPDGLATFATRPEAAFGPSVINFTLNDVKNWQVLGAEGALVYGPLSLQSEVFASTVNRADHVANNFYGAYAYVSYFLTGEHRPYNRKLGVFDRVRPYENFFRVRTGDGDVCTGRGAWEVLYRASYANTLDALDVKGSGRILDHTVGLNWYLNPYARIMWNYVHSQDDFAKTTGNVLSGGDMDQFEMRFAIDF